MAGLLIRRRVRRMVGLAVIVLGSVTLLLVRGKGSETYVPGQSTDGLVDSLGRSLPADRPSLTFRDTATEAGLRFRHFPGTRTNRLPEDMGSGVALGDVDGDGWPDAFLVNAHPLPSPETTERPDAASTCRLFHNRGDGTFEDVTERSGTGLSMIGMAAAFLDTEGDGDLDLLVTSYGGLSLRINDGTGTFHDGTLAAGLAGFRDFYTGIAAGDPDGDDDVDVYVCGYVRYDESLAPVGRSSSQYGADIPVRINPSAFAPEPNLLLRNRGDGTFEEVAAALGIDNPSGRSLAATFADLSGDGHVDLYVANDVSDNAFFVNRGDGTFEDRTSQALVGDYRGAMGLAVGDFDEDQDQDFFITHWIAQENALYVNITPDLSGAAEGQLVFFDEADRWGLGQIALPFVGWATRFFDYDADGHLDLFVVNGSTIPTRDDPSRLTPMTTQLFWNAGGSRGYFDVGPASGPFFSQRVVGRGGATFDYDLDGREDLLVQCHGGDAALLHNEGGTIGGSLRVRLRQPRGNTHALGATIRVSAGGRVRLDALGTQGSYLSQHVEGEAVFGLGNESSVDTLEVTWPDGVRESSGPFAADSLVTWVRGQSPVVQPLPGRRSAGEPGGPLDADTQRRFFALLDRASALRVEGDFTGAAAAYREALQVAPGHEDCLYYLGNCLLEAGDEPAAAHAFDELARRSPRSSRAWMQLGKLRLPGGDPTLDDLAGARAAFERAHAINGEESGPVVHLGLVALLDHDLDEAERWLEDAAMLNARSVEVRYWLGCIAFLRGDEAGALTQLEEAHVAASLAGGSPPSASSEGDTRSGRALLATREHAGSGLVLDRWRSLRERPVDVGGEYAALVRELGLGRGESRR